MAQFQTFFVALNRVCDAFIATCLNNDQTLRTEVLSIVQYLMKNAAMSEKEIMLRINSRPEETRQLLQRLLACRSDFAGIEPRTIGPDITSFICSDNLQKALNVKSLGNNLNSSNINNSNLYSNYSGKYHATIYNTKQKQYQNLPITPNIKTGMLYSSQDICWVRIYCYKKGQIEEMKKDTALIRFTKIRSVGTFLEEDNSSSNIVNNTTTTTILAADSTDRKKKAAIKKNQQLIIPEEHNYLSYVQFDESDVFEIYYFKPRKTILLINYLEAKYKCAIIFSSTLKVFKYNLLLFISNYVKFMWCYIESRLVFDPNELHEHRRIMIFIIYGILFLNTDNLSCLNPETCNPLISYTGEKPREALLKYIKVQPDKVYRCEGTRPMISIDKSDDFGAISNFIEIVCDLNLH